jgi:hypothetical protein
MRGRVVWIGIVAVLSALLARDARGQGATAFTYQGELRTDGLPADGLHDLRFRLFDLAAGGVQVGPVVCLDNVSVIDGRFVVLIDFGPAFESFGRHLEVSVRDGATGACPDETSFVTLAPLQPITAVPQAGFAADAGTAVFADSALSLAGQPASFYTSASNLATGTLSDSRLSNNVPLRSSASTQTFAGAINAPAFSGGGSGITGLNANNIASGIINDARLPTNLARLDAASNTFLGPVVVESNIAITADNGELSIQGPPGSFKALRLSFLNGNANLSATGLNSTLTLSGGNSIGSFRLDTFGRVAIAQTLSIGTSETTNDDLRVRGDGSIVKVALESGGADQVAELAFYENLSNTNGVILREDGRGSANHLQVIDLSGGGETVLATFDRDSDSFSAPVKAFRIDHPLDPLNKELWHSCVESPDMLNIYSGTVTTDDRGYAQITLPAYFAALNIEPRYQLTVVEDEADDAGDSAAADWVLAKVARPIGRDGPDRFTIRTSVPGTTVSWLVTGVRNDPAARRSRIVPERDKPAHLRGTLLVPTDFALPAAIEGEGSR